MRPAPFRILVVGALAAYSSSTEAQTLQAAASTVEVVGTVASKVVHSITSSETIVDGKPGASKLTIAAIFEVQDAGGVKTEFLWGDDPETVVLDKAGKRGAFRHFAVGDKVTVKAAKSGTTWRAVEIKLTDKDIPPSS